MSPTLFIIVDMLQWQNDTVCTWLFSLVKGATHSVLHFLTHTHYFYWTMRSIHRCDSNYQWLPSHLPSSYLQIGNRLTTKFPNTTHMNPVCSQFIYPVVEVCNTNIGPVWLFIDTSSGQHGRILRSQFSHRESNTTVTIYFHRHE